MITDDVFARMVAEEVKNRLSPNQKIILMEPENWGRWKTALTYLVENLEEQIDNIKADAINDAERYQKMGHHGKKLLVESEKAYKLKITKVERFLFHVQRRLDDVVSMIETGEVAKSDGWQEVSFLKRAITKHRAMLRDYDLEETAIDRSLWDALDNRWTFDDIDPGSI
jgi:hypothetical protein